MVGLAGLDLQLGSAGLGFEVEAGQTENVTFTYSLPLGAGITDDFTLVVQHLVNGQWVAVSGTGEASFLNLDVLSGNSVTLTGLGAGEYRAFMTYNGGLLDASILGTLSATADVFDPNQIVNNYTVATAHGNVLDDAGIGGQADITTPFTVVSYVQHGVNSVAVNATGTTTIEGQYGTLVISANGSYTYTPHADVVGLGQVDSFTYTIFDPTGNDFTATANLYFHIDSNAVDMTWGTDPTTPATVAITANNDLATAEINFGALQVGDDVPLGSQSYLALVGLLGLNVPVLGTPAIGFNVEAGHAEDAKDVGVRARYLDLLMNVLDEPLLLPGNN
ncbi:MAG: hypothetical protein EOP49_45375 [Sphingobacteriales bacterium]|nr:MAG: hypothetical protein EOP49_45375 [Sphingobacteriales bacterium]